MTSTTTMRASIGQAVRYHSSPCQACTDAGRTACQGHELPPPDTVTAWLVDPRPFACPVCFGSGRVYSTWSAFPLDTQPCHPCGGTGIVWGPPR